VGRVIIIIGVVILISGVVFHLQGKGVVGPEESFMYSNPDWVTFGLQFAIVGVIIIGIGTGIEIYFFKKR